MFENVYIMFPVLNNSTCILLLAIFSHQSVPVFSPYLCAVQMDFIKIIYTPLRKNEERLWIINKCKCNQHAIVSVAQLIVSQDFD